MEYRLLVDIEVVEALDALPKKTRTRLINHFYKIRSFPENHSDYHERDSAGRRVEICVFAGHAIHYWTDFADRHVKILALKPADTGAA
ncbi:MAG TPA: hypothetical protein VF437_01580 [Verrucomicrobiae bacterium]|jgi:hypothetical protein